MSWASGELGLNVRLSAWLAIPVSLTAESQAGTAISHDPAQSRPSPRSSGRCHLLSTFREIPGELRTRLPSADLRPRKCILNWSQDTRIQESDSLTWGWGREYVWRKT